MANVNSKKLLSDDLADRRRPLTKVRIIFPDSLNQQQAKFIVQTEMSFELSLCQTGAQDSRELKVSLQRFYDLPVDTNINALLNDVDAATQEGKLAEEKIRIEGKTTETYFDMEVTLPPGQNLPEHFYLSLLRGDIPGAFCDMNEDSTYTMRVHQTAKQRYVPRKNDEPIKKKRTISELEQEWDKMFHHQSM